MIDFKYVKWIPPDSSGGGGDSDDDDFNPADQQFLLIGHILSDVLQTDPDGIKGFMKQNPEVQNAIIKQRSKLESNVKAELNQYKTDPCPWEDDVAEKFSQTNYFQNIGTKKCWTWDNREERRKQESLLEHQISDAMAALCDFKEVKELVYWDELKILYGEKVTDVLQNLKEEK